MRGLPRFIGPLAALALLGGCEPTLDDVRAWKGLSEGPRQIAAIIPDGDRSPDLRLGAAMILVDLGEVFALADALKATPDSDRQSIVENMLPRLLALLKVDDVDQAAKAKDALFYLGGYLPAAKRDKAGKSIIAWATADFSGRFAAGRTTLVQVLPDMGTASVPALLKLLAEGEAIPEVVKILSSFESQAVHDEAATTLVGLIDGLGDKAPPEAWSHVDRFVSPKLTPFLLAQLKDPDVSAELKDRYFDHVATCGGPEAAPGLAKLMAQRDMRWIAAQALLALDDLAGLQRVLKSLPTLDKGYRAPELSDEISFFCNKTVAQLKASKAAVQAALVGALSAARPTAAATAATCLKLHGASEAIPALQLLARSKTVLPGWKGRAPVGALAQEAIAAIRQRGE